MSTGEAMSVGDAMSIGATSIEAPSGMTPASLWRAFDPQPTTAAKPTTPHAMATRMLI
jgi:hypothetical protein